MSERSESVDRVAEFVLDAVEQKRAPRSDWLDAVSDAATELARLLDRAGHPDDYDKAANVMTALAHIWLSEDEADDVYLGGREP